MNTITQLPCLADADLCVMGASAAGTAAAIAAAHAGVRVVILAERHGLGDDLAGTLELWAGGEPSDPLAQRLWPVPFATPVHLMAVLEQAALEAGVTLLYGCGFLDAAAGVVTVSSSGGPVAVRARMVMDATRLGLLSGGLIGPRRLGLIVMGDAPDGGVLVGEAEGPWLSGRKGRFWRIERTSELAGNPAAAWAGAECDLREAAFTPGELRCADEMIHATATRPHQAGERLVVAGPLAVPPAERIALGTAFGRRLARDIAGMQPSTAAAPLPAAAGLGWLPACGRWRRLPRIAVEPVAAAHFGAWDVVVLGGGTGGAPAGLAAAEAGARTLVAEGAPGLGGVGTLGRIGRYWHGNRVGATARIDCGVAAMGPDGPDPARGAWHATWKSAWYLRELRRAGAQVWLGARGAACQVEAGRVTGLLLTTPAGTGLAGCGCSVDASGNACIAAAAGAPCTGIGAAHMAVQGSGLSPSRPGTSYSNTDWTFIDDNDPQDLTRAFVQARRKYAGEFDTSPIVNTRERRQILSELDMGPLDLLAGRTFPDTVMTACSNFDSHGFTIHPIFLVEPANKEPLRAHVPLRSLLPQGLEGVLVVGLGMGAHRDALPVIRMQPDVQNAGWAAGRCAATAALQHGGRVRAVDIRALQGYLASVGCLDPEVAGHEDSFPLPEAMIAAAVRQGLPDHRALAMVFSAPALSLPHLRRHAGDLRAAQVLGLLGDPAGAPRLVEAIDAHSKWDTGWRYTGMGQFGRSVSHLDALIIAAGACRAPGLVPQLIRLIGLWDDSVAFSHVRALAEAAASVPDPSLARALTDFLRRPGIAGHHMDSLATAAAAVDGDGIATADREQALRELAAARGLWYCGDPEGVAAGILRAYAGDLRGHFASHASAILR